MGYKGTDKEIIRWNRNQKLVDFVGDEKLPHYLFKSEIKFETDWDNWLMKLVNEIYIKSDARGVGLVNEYVANVRNAVASISLENIYKACCEYVDWYLENKPNEETY